MSIKLSLAITNFVEVCWSNWSDICALHPQLINRDNPGSSSNKYHSVAGDLRYMPPNAGSVGPYLLVNVPAELSALQVNGKYVSAVAYQGDYLLLMENDRIAVLPAISGSVLTISESLDTGVDLELATSFVFNIEDFPKYSKWVHKNGNLYVITGYSNLLEPAKPEHPPTIHYNNAVTDAPFSRFAYDWARSFTKVG